MVLAITQTILGHLTGQEVAEEPTARPLSEWPHSEVIAAFRSHRVQKLLLEIYLSLPPGIEFVSTMPLLETHKHAPRFA